MASSSGSAPRTLRTADVRLISATLHPISDFIASGRFREDLFFRINGITLTVPPLREREGDLPLLLVDEIARASRAQRKHIVGLDREAADRLFAYPWPGNLRELSKVVQAAVALTRGDVIEPDDLVLQAVPATTAGPASVTVGARPAGTPAHSSTGAPPGPSTVEATASRSARLRDVVDAHVRQVLASVGGNKRQAARVLGVSRTTLDCRLKGD